MKEIRLFSIIFLFCLFGNALTWGCWVPCMFEKASQSSRSGGEESLWSVAQSWFACAKSPKPEPGFTVWVQFRQWGWIWCLSFAQPVDKAQLTPDAVLQSVLASEWGHAHSCLSSTALITALLAVLVEVTEETQYLDRKGLEDAERGDISCSLGSSTSSTQHWGMFCPLPAPAGPVPTCTKFSHGTHSGFLWFFLDITGSRMCVADW